LVGLAGGAGGVVVPVVGGVDLDAEADADGAPPDWPGIGWTGPDPHAPTRAAHSTIAAPPVR
jgi:hypothetical protein